MRVALVVAAAGVLAVAVACGGGTSSTDPLDSRDPPPATGDVAPSGTDSPPSSVDSPPTGNDSPPAPGEGSTGPGACSLCHGSYSCVVDGATAELSLQLVGGVCDVTYSIPNEGTGTVAVACGDVSLDAGTGNTSYSLDSNGDVEACSSDGSGICAVCTHSDAVTLSPVDSGLTLNTPGSGGTTPSGGGSSQGSGGCAALATCCSALSSVVQPACNATVANGNAPACGAALTGYESAGLCP
jgi:hypothetical protein